MTRKLSIHSLNKPFKKQLLFYSLLSALFLLIVFLCILLFSFTNHFEQLPYSSIAFAKEPISHNFSEAYRISNSSKKQISLPAYDSCCFYIEKTSAGNVTIQISPFSNLQIQFYSDKGRRITFSGHRDGKKHLFTLDKSYLKNNTRIFFQIKNKSNSTQKYLLSTSLCKEHISKPEKKKQNTKTKTTSTIPRTKHTKKKSIVKLPATVKKNYMISPGFLRCKTGKKATLKLFLNKKSIKNSSVVWTSSNPSVASIHQGILLTKKEGLSIIFARQKKEILCSCLVRIID